MQKILIYALFPLSLPFLLANSVYAHGVDGNGFYAGLTHPIGGLDHLMAMLSVGILSTQMEGRHIWLIPSTFVAIMLVGGYSGYLEPTLFVNMVEYGILFSVLFLGLVIAKESKLPATLIYLLVGFFGFFHGYAHGVEFPGQTQPQYYAAGFVVSTIMIHIVGVCIGFAYAVGQKKGALLLRYTGAIIMGMGLQMILDSIL